MNAIHPQTDKIFAESPYTRKLKRLLEDLSVMVEFAPESDKTVLREMQVSVLTLLGGN